MSVERDALRHTAYDVQALEWSCDYRKVKWTKQEKYNLIQNLFSLPFLVLAAMEMKVWMDTLHITPNNSRI